jgi:hypothetical protein
MRSVGCALCAPNPGEWPASVRCARWDALSALLAKPKDGHEGLVNTPLLFRAYSAYEFTEPSGVDGPDLLNQNAGGLPEQVNLRAERRRPGAA